MTDLWGIVPAGGAGTRLWPLSRANSPKFLLDLTGAGRTLLQQTCDRLEPLTEGRIIVVTGAAHEAAVSSQVSARVIAEPSPRDSMAAIGLAAAIVEREDPDAVVGSFAADQVIGDAAAFGACVAEAVEVAAGGQLVTLGIVPTAPSEAFGYIHATRRYLDYPTALAVESFVEKPDRDRAIVYLAAGGYWWNAGMFVCRPTVLLDLLAENHPELAAGVREIAADPASMDRIWPGLEKIAIDHAVAEPAAASGRVVTVPGTFAWDDIGDFAALAGDSGLTTHGDVVEVSTSGLVINQTDRPVAVVGIDDVIVVQTADATLVTTRGSTQRVKAVVDRLREEGRTDLL